MMNRIISAMIVLFVLFSLCACNLMPHEKAYYLDKENYVSVTGTVSHVVYDEDTKTLYLSFSEMSESFSDDHFKIVGDNYAIVNENSIGEKLKIGQTVTFTTAPRYFGDGYVMPIVAISIDGEVLLEFEEGYSNFIRWLNG